jgi:hypothetical protein
MLLHHAALLLLMLLLLPALHQFIGHPAAAYRLPTKSSAHGHETSSSDLLLLLWSCCTQ